MAYSFTYREIFSPGAFRHTWLDIGRSNRYLRFVAGPGLIIAYALCALIDGAFPPNNEFLSPFAFDILPVILVFGVLMYFMAWTADEYPVHSSRVLAATGTIFSFGYILLVGLYEPGTVLNRIGFLLYLVTVSCVAFAQLLAPRSDSSAEDVLR